MVDVIVRSWLPRRHLLGHAAVGFLRTIKLHWITVGFADMDLDIGAAADFDKDRP